jgi:hypothetical protein
LFGATVIIIIIIIIIIINCGRSVGIVRLRTKTTEFLVLLLLNATSIIRMFKSRLPWAGYAARIEAMANAYRILVGKPEGKRPLGRPRRRWEEK